MLARLEPEQLDAALVPARRARQAEVRELARDAGLPVADSRESQDLCFLAGPAAGPSCAGTRADLAADARQIVDIDGRVLGEHDGQDRFTVGQRRGLGRRRGRAPVRGRKDARAATVTVGPRTALDPRRASGSRPRVPPRGRRRGRA